MYELECDSCQTVIEVDREELDSLYRSDGYAHCEECDHILAIIEQPPAETQLKLCLFFVQRQCNYPKAKFYDTDNSLSLRSIQNF